MRDTKTGRIVGFLQEARPLAKLVGSGAGVVGGAAAAPGVLLMGVAAVGVLKVGGLVQGEATRRGVKRTEAVVNRIDGKVDQLGEGMVRVEDKLGAMNGELASIGSGIDFLKMTGLANLALGAAGIGVSVVGFGIMSAKLGVVQRSIHALADQLESVRDKIDRLRQDAIDADFSELKSLAELYDECWQLDGSARAEQQWHRIQQDALVFQNRFADRAQKLLSNSTSNVHAADTMMDAVALASSLRVASLVACNEATLARSAANESSRQVESLTGKIGLAELAGGATAPSAEPGTPAYELTLGSAREAARPLLRKLREREAAVATRAAPLDSLEKLGIAPKAWLAAARDEKEEPLLFLEAGE
ncbi:MAG: hypothetical protein ABIT04_11820 [Novosphingobium sp.]